MGHAPEWVQPEVKPVESPPPAEASRSPWARFDRWTMDLEERLRSSSRFFVWCMYLFLILAIALDGVLWNLRRSAAFCTWYLVGLGALCVAALVPMKRRLRELVREERRKAGQCLSCGYDLRGSAGRCPECGAGETNAQ